MGIVRTFVGSGFGPEDVVNRRVNTHLQELLPAQVSAQKDYHFEGQRWLPPDRLPDDAAECLCLLESYVGREGRFEIHIERVFDRESDAEWRIDNTITRSGSESLSPFAYRVTSEIELMGDTESDRARVSWHELGADPIYGGREAQAAVLLTEKMAHLRAREHGQELSHAGSLSRLGSLSNVIDTGHQLRADWEDVDALLGPDAETIAATVGFDALESREQRLAAERKGIDFLTTDIEDLQRDRAREQQSEDTSEGERPDWQTPPAELTVAETEAELRKLQARLQQLKQEFDETESE